MSTTINSNKKEIEYKKSIANYFGKKNEYWKVVYDPKQKEGDLFDNMHLRTRKKTVLRFIDDCSKGSKRNILDIGCGTGLLMKEMIHRGHNVIGMDISRDMLTLAKKTVSDYSSETTTFSLGDVEKLPYKDKSFDIVTCVGVIEYLYNENLGISEIRRVVKDDGYLIVTLPNILKLNTLLDPYYYLNRGMKFVLQKIKNNRSKNQKVIKQENDFSTNDNFCNKRYFRAQALKLFKKYRFHEVDSVSLGFGPPTFWKKHIYSYKTSISITESFEKLSRNKSFSFMNYLPNRWVICQQKSNN
jgi:ubiquinone/menaquinone biosynthesis C-methylase UbiE